MNPGELRHRVIIQQKTNISMVDENNVTREVWQDVSSIWTAIEPLSGKNIIKVDEINLNITTKVKARYSPMISELVRIKFGSRYFDIFDIVDVKNKQAEMHLMCGEVIELDKLCKVYRYSGAKDDLKRPVKNLQLIQTYPCTFVRNSSQYKQETPNAFINSQYTLYGESVMDIHPGDLLEVEGVKYVASMPYKPKNHHTEVEIMVKKDV